MPFIRRPVFNGIVSFFSEVSCYPDKDETGCEIVLFFNIAVLFKSYVAFYVTQFVCGTWVAVMCLHFACTLCYAFILERMAAEA